MTAKLFYGPMVSTHITSLIDLLLVTYMLVVVNKTSDQSAISFRDLDQLDVNPDNCWLAYLLHNHWCLPVADTAVRSLYRH